MDNRERMAAGSLPFVLYIKSVKGDWLALFRDQQVRGFFSMVSVAAICLTIWLYLKHWPLLSAVRQAVFNVTSIVTTTGYASDDYSTWGTLPVSVFLMLTFLGGCTGSTAGAIKGFRLQIMRSIRV